MSGGGYQGMNYTGGGTLPSKITIEVDEFKFFNIMRHILFKQDIISAKNDHGECEKLQET
jgi:hypothetical protein